MAGAIGPGPERVQAMVDAFRHRGPDDAGILAVDRTGVTLGSARLSIIDLSPAGHMPMQDAEAGLTVVHNGEIYNHRDLRAELEREGARFRSNTDTEVLLKAWARWGVATLGRLEGMFAFAIHDARSGELVLARDRLGEKPLYFTTEGPFAFSSEVRALLAAGAARPRLDPAGLASYLANGFVVAPLTLIRDVRSLPPGHLLRVGPDGRPREERAWWRLPAAAREGAPQDPAPLREALVRSVRRRLMSDVPLGAFLSGGLDSAVQVAVMADAGSDVRTFSVTFDETAFDESVHSRRAAQAFGTRHTEVRLRQDTFESWLPAAEAAFDQPSFDGLNTYYVSRAARESGLTVALSGTGADELFGGYPYFPQVRMLRRLLALPATSPAARLFPASADGVAGIRKVAAMLAEPRTARPVLAAYQGAQRLLPSGPLQAVAAGPVAEAAATLVHGLPPAFVDLLDGEAEGDELDRISRLSLRLFLGERCLRDADTTSMAVSLELRAPFVDHHVVEAALALPGRVRCRGGPHKPFAQEMARPLLQGRYERRDKQGFIFPFERWLRRSEAADRVRRSLHDPGLAALGLQPAGVARLAEGFFGARRTVPWSRVWALHSLVAWCRRHGVTL